MDIPSLSPSHFACISTVSSRHRKRRVSTTDFLCSLSAQSVPFAPIGSLPNQPGVSYKIPKIRLDTPRKRASGSVGGRLTPGPGLA